MLRRLLIGLVIASAIIACPALIPFVAPGILLTRRRGLPWVHAALVPAVSLAFWAVVIQWLRWVHAPLDALAIGVAAASLVAFVGLSGQAEHTADHDRGAFVLVAVAMLLRLSPLLFMDAPAGADMSMHAAMARLIALANGFPPSQRPYLPVDSIGAYPLGFHTAVAIGVRLGGDILRDALFAACAVQAVAVGALYAALRRLGAPAWPAAIASVLALYGCSLPQTGLSWGGAPTVLGFALLFACVALIPEPEPGPKPSHSRALSIALLALMAAGAASSHLIPVATGLYALGGAALWLAFAYRRNPAARRVVAQVLLAAALAVALLVPYFTSGTATVSDFERQWVRTLVADEHLRVLRSPLLFSSVGPLVPVLAVIGLAKAGPERRPLVIACLLAMLGTAVCFLATYGFWLPQAELLYPTRIGTVLLLPLGLGTAWFTERALLTGRRKMLTSAAAILALFCLFMHVHEYQMGAADDVVVTRDDAEALRWIASNVPKDALIANNYGDAGLWIPAVCGRAITRVHSNPFYFAEYLEARKNQTADWVYVGERFSYPKRARPWRLPDADQDERLHLEFARGGARVYRVASRPIAVAPLLPPAASSSEAP